MANPLASDQTHLRASLLPGLLEVLRLNQARGNDAQRLFEKGRVYHLDGDHVVEMVSVGFIIQAQPQHRKWQESPAKTSIAKKTALDILRIAGVEKQVFETNAIKPLARWALCSCGIGCRWFNS